MLKAEREIKERRFVAYYLTNGGNGTGTAISAGYSPKSARTIAWRLKRKPHVAEAINQAHEDAIDKLFRHREREDPYDIVLRMLNKC